MEENSLRQRVLDYAAQTYQTQPEYLWSRLPTFAVLRHEENRKWYALVAAAPRSALGLSGGGEVPVLNVKCAPALMDALLRQRGYYPGYHMNKGSWLTVLLDGSVAIEEILPLIDLSYQATERKITPRRGKKLPPEA